MKPKPVDKLSSAFGVMKGYLPEWNDIPEEFKRHRGTKFNDLISGWFFSGLDQSKITPKEGINRNEALRHIGACLRSFEPKHEHKEAGCAYLMSQWFDIVEEK